MMTEAELEIMETLWAKGEPIYLGELLDVFNARTKKDWKKQTLNTFLFKMQQKNLVETVEGARFKKYLPAITREAYLEDVSKAFLDRNFGGSFAKMLTTLNGRGKTDEKEIEALKQVLKGWEQE
ncbi:MAG: BlaI/MecI/CopY family transcriptional regulator [Lachnospiraceae bacterium]|nr:BlaI/MecI/CopY family transcriptional regulator [Lachnospiraceae bacterium]